MGYSIKVSSTVLEAISGSLASAGRELDRASSILNGICISSRNGGNLGLRSTSQTAGEALSGYKRDMNHCVDLLQELSKRVLRTKALFEEFEARFIRSGIPNVTFVDRNNMTNIYPGSVDGQRTNSFAQAIGQCGASNSSQYQKDVALAMLELSGIAYNDQETGWYDKQKLADLGFTNSTYLDPPGALIAWRLNEAGEPLIAIAFRGTSKAADFAADALAADNESGVHTGFDFYADLFTSQLNSVILEGIDGRPTLAELISQTQEGGKANFLLTGHSLGGAEAQISAYRFLQQGVPNDLVSAYTFASPQPFTHSSVDEELGDKAHVYNIINRMDLVTHVGAVNDELPPGFSLLDNRNIGTDIKTMPTAREVAGNIYDSAIDAVFTSPIASPVTPIVGAINIINGNHSLDTYKKILERM